MQTCQRYCKTTLVLAGTCDQRPHGIAVMRNIEISGMQNKQSTDSDNCGIKTNLILSAKITLRIDG